MTYDQRELGIGAGIWVSGISLIVASYICLSMIYENRKHRYFYEAQKMLDFIYFAPIIIGWPTWVIILLGNEGGIFEYIVDIYKAMIFYFLISYVLAMIGRISDGKGYVYNQEKMINSFLSIERTGFFFLFCGKIKLRNKKWVKSFLFYVRLISVLYIVTYICIFIAILLLLYVDGDNLHYGEIDPNYGYFWINITIICVTILSSHALYTFIHTIKKIPNLKGFRIKSKFYIIEVFAMLIQVQPLIFSAFAEWNWISDNDKYETDEIASFTSNFILCIEMVIFAFMLKVLFPYTDYIPSTDSSNEPLKI
ncbi:unnamed protein product [Blepharisma stoltei]|uniref:Gustatory receptor n=1 Tax=Blepharisma stoltei TaxID=1481888 RepID=A0AAU9KC36_9CILI|nr:unnamed protein product [Blepharisma stoltei]